MTTPHKSGLEQIRKCKWMQIYILIPLYPSTNIIFLTIKNQVFLPTYASECQRSIENNFFKFLYQNNLFQLIILSNLMMYKGDV